VAHAVLARRSGRPSQATFGQAALATFGGCRSGLVGGLPRQILECGPERRAQGVTQILAPPERTHRCLGYSQHLSIKLRRDTRVAVSKGRDILIGRAPYPVPRILPGGLAD